MSFDKDICLIFFAAVSPNTDFTIVTAQGFTKVSSIELGLVCLVIANAASYDASKKALLLKISFKIELQPF